MTTLYVASVAQAGLIIVYVAIVIGGARFGPVQRAALPLPLNSIALSALSLGSVLTFIAAGRISDRQARARQDAVMAHWRTNVEQRLAAQAARIEQILTAVQRLDQARADRHPDNEDTRPLTSRVVYASLSGTQGGQIAAFGDGLMAQVELSLAAFKAGVAGTVTEAKRQLDEHVSDLDEVLATHDAFGGSARHNVRQFPARSG